MRVSPAAILGAASFGIMLATIVIMCSKDASSDDAWSAGGFLGGLVGLIAGILVGSVGPTAFF